MKKLQYLKLLFAVTVLSLLAAETGCKKDDNDNNNNNNNNNTGVVLATVETSAIVNITQTGATSGGNITSAGGGSITARGVCWSTNHNPTTSDSKTTDGTGTGTFASTLTNLTPGTTYYVRGYAVNSAGTAYGNELSLTTLPNNCVSVTDIDGNTYNAVQIGSQCWMQKNLQTTKYRNGDLIGNGATDWTNLTTGAWAIYNNDVQMEAIYGKLYNWHAVNDSRGLCPDGFHVPDSTEWQTMVIFLGGNSSAGGKMKEAGTSHWNTPNTGATNESGFTGLPGGYRYYSTGFYQSGNYAYWWLSEEENTTNAKTRFLDYYYAGVYQDKYDKNYGLSVRCLKD